MELDAALVAELRQHARRGVSPCELAAMIGRRLNMETKNYRIEAIAYFREAFALSLADAMLIGAAPSFPDAHRAAAEVDAELRPLIEASQHIWSR